MPSFYVTLQGAAGLDARITLPRTGTWQADVAVDAASASSFTGAATLVIGGGAVTMKGKIRRAAFAEGVVKARMVGGADGWRSILPAKSYGPATLGLVLNDLCREAGETLSTTTADELLATPLPAWTRLQGSASAALQMLLGVVPGAVWRVLADGTTWCGAETWPSESPAYTLLHDATHLARWELFSDPPTLRPGTTFASRRVSVVEHRFTPIALRTFVWFEP
jgi:hypothetical protein